MSVRRGSMTISFAPLPQPAFHPACEHRVAIGRVRANQQHDIAVLTLSKSCVPALVPNVVFRPYPVGEWQTRAQVSTLLLPNPARTSFWTRKVSSLVQRLDVIPPSACLPYFSLIRLSSDAA